MEELGWTSNFAPNIVLGYTSLTDVQQIKKITKSVLSGGVCK